MLEQKVIKNESREYFIVKANELFVSGRKLDNNNPLKLHTTEWDATKYETLAQALEIAGMVKGDVVRVIFAEIHTKAYEKVV